MKIRQINLNDAGNFLILCKTLDSESKFMMFEPDERIITVQEQAQSIENMLHGHLSQIFVCEINKKLVGYSCQ
jgi:hypothetical protein